MSEPEPHDCGPDCHPLRAYDGVSPACSDDCQKPLGHPGGCTTRPLAGRRGGYIPGGPVQVTFMPGEEIVYPDGRIYRVTATGVEYVRTDPAIPAHALKMLDQLRTLAAENGGRP